MLLNIGRFLLLTMIFFTFSVGCPGSNFSTQTQLESTSQPNPSPISSTKIVGLSYPPFKKKKHIDFTISALKALNIRKIRISPNWKNREPDKGKFNWKPFDKIINAARRNNISILLTIPNDGPDWACSDVKNKKACVFKNEKDFTLYLTKLLTRYPETFERIQFGNEWELHYPGSMKDFVRFNNLLYEITKKYSPEIQVVLGGITRGYPMVELMCHQKRELDFSDLMFSNHYSEKTLKRKIEREYCHSNIKEKVLYVFNNAKYDAIDIHLYDDPRNWKNYIEILPNNKPIIVSEFGGPSSIFELNTDLYQAERLKAYIQVIESLPILEAYYFNLIDSKYSYHKKTGLFNKNFKEKAAYRIFFEYINR